MSFPGTNDVENGFNLLLVVKILPTDTAFANVPAFPSPKLSM